MRTHAIALAAAFLLGLACCGGGAAVESTPQAPAAGPIVVTVSAKVMTKDRTDLRPFFPCQTLRSGDYFEYFVRTDRPAYVYVVQVFAGVRAKVLNPGDAQQSIPAHEERRIPANSGLWFQLDEKIGAERVYLVVSAKPLQATDDEIAAAVLAIAGDSGCLVASPTPSVAAAPAVGAASTPASPPPPPLRKQLAGSGAKPALSGHEKSVDLTGKDVLLAEVGDGVSRTMVGQVDDRGLQVLYFQFQHVP